METVRLSDLRVLVINGNIEVIEGFVLNKAGYVNNIARLAIQQGKLNILKWAVSKGYTVWEYGCYHKNVWSVDISDYIDSQLYKQKRSNRY